MNGDFSQWGFEPSDNWNGVLHQQGRVLLDRDWNAATQIERHQRRWIARDAFGANVAAVPANSQDSFKVTQAQSDGTNVTITYNPGVVWADGLRLDVLASVPLVAQYLAPPVQTPQASATTIANGVRDAVILDVWEDSFSAFQDPLNLIEPALGGADTTERIHTVYALRLLRLVANDECGNLVDKLADNFGAKGKLSVTPAPNVVVTGDCPVQMGGGYSGFEHYLYRIEIADPDAGGHARFKWSQFNGGLVGRGVFSSTGAGIGKVDISANDQAINHCGLTSFYLEALAFDASLGYWRVVLSADATLPQDGELSLANIVGAWPATAPASAFFRLWNGVELVSDFPINVTPSELKDGILLQLDAPTAGNANYTPGDYWTFPVRAAGVPFDPSTWPTAEAPQGVHHHRVPLAILDWDAGPADTLTAGSKIHDCREVFQPLTRQKSCCTYRVGDNMTSFGDFGKIQDAIDALPQPDGGEVCVLPGNYPENLVLAGKQNVRIVGCGDECVVTAPAAQPVVLMSGVQNVQISGLQLVANRDAQGVLVDSSSVSSAIDLRELTISAMIKSGIEVQAGQTITIRDCRVLMQDVATSEHAVSVTATDVVIQENLITVQPAQNLSAGGQTQVAAAAGRGGLHLGGTSERIQVLDNLIQYGIGNGITLGSIETVDNLGNVIEIFGWVVNVDDPCDPCQPGDTGIVTGGGGGSTTQQSTGPLYEIEIARNRILDMGLNGIGVIGFFDLSAQDEFISVVGLDILGNQIRRCLQRPLATIPAGMIDSMGYGGIALADVEYLVIHDNVIQDNGPDHVQPVCGIFLLHGEGVDISRNRILNNGAKTREPSAGAKAGRRGGINVVYGIADEMPLVVGAKSYPRQDGVPAVRVHDNIVSHPLGQALALTALGPVSVVGNQFTSMGVIVNAASPTFWAGCVMISNLGQSNEIYWQNLSFDGIVNTSANSLAQGNQLNVSNGFVALPQAGLDDQRKGQYLADGNVMFANNQCVLDLVEPGVSIAVTAVFITSLDDVAFSDNQCDCNLLDDFVIAQVFLFGFSVRINDNRLKEGIFNALLSAISFGFMNAATNNQSTHCLMCGSALPVLNVNTGNKALVDAIVPNYCGALTKAFAAQGGFLGLFSQ